MWIKILRTVVQIAVVTGFADKAKNWALKRVQKLEQKATDKLQATEDKLVDKAKAAYAQHIDVTTELAALKAELGIEDK